MSNYYEPKNNDSMYLGGEPDWKQMWPKYDEENGIPTASFPYPKQTAFEDVFYSSASVQTEKVRKAFLDRLNGNEEPVQPMLNAKGIKVKHYPTPAIERQVGGDHYKKAGNNMQPWDIIDAWKLDFYEGSVLSYLLRSKYKGERLKDLQKIQHYLDKMIEDADAS